MLKTLVENNISYTDIKYGNLIFPNIPSFQDMMLVDFGSAKIDKTPQDAAKEVLNSKYGTIWVEFFESIPAENQGKMAKESLEALRAIAKE